LCVRSDEEDEADSEAKTALKAKGGMLKKKVLAVSKLLRFYRVLR
jgi:hypothetical protein